MRSLQPFGAIIGVWATHPDYCVSSCLSPVDGLGIEEEVQSGNARELGNQNEQCLSTTL